MVVCARTHAIDRNVVQLEPTHLGLDLALRDDYELIACLGRAKVHELRRETRTQRQR